MKKIPQDIIGNIAILKFKKNSLWFLKKIQAYRFLKKNKKVTTVREKVGKISGDLRIHKTKHLAGIKTTIATYKENNCTFTFDVDKTYFSSRLSNERKIVAEEVVSLSKKKKHVSILVLFSGVGPYPIVLAKRLKKEKIKTTIYANELNRDAIKFAKDNSKKNKVDGLITFLPGDARDLPSSLNQRFDIILMPRPNISETFLQTALTLSKSGTNILYHGFGTEENVKKELEKETKGKMKLISMRKAGDIRVNEYRWQVNLVVK